MLAPDVVEDLGAGADDVAPGWEVANADSDAAAGAVVRTPEEGAGAALVVVVGAGAVAEPLLLHPARAMNAVAANAAPMVEVRVADENAVT